MFSSGSKSKSRSVRVRIDNCIPIGEKRVFERYPTSLYADVRTRSARKRETAFIKNLSLNGIYMLSRFEFNVDEIVEMDIFIDSLVIPAKPKICWKKQGEHYFEYGLEINLSDVNAKQVIKNKLLIIREEHEKEISELRRLRIKVFPV